MRGFEPHRMHFRPLMFDLTIWPRLITRHFFWLIPPFDAHDCLFDAWSFFDFILLFWCLTTLTPHLMPDLVLWCAQTPRLSTLMPLHDPPWHNNFDFYISFSFYNNYFSDYCNNTQKHGHNLPDWRDLTTKHSCPSGLRGRSAKPFYHRFESDRHLFILDS